MARPPRYDLVKIVAEVKLAIAALPEFDFRDQSPYRAAVTQLRVDLEAKGARFDGRYGSLQVSYAGVRATSSNDASGAMRNWIKAAYRKLDRRSLVEG